MSRIGTLIIASVLGAPLAANEHAHDGSASTTATTGLSGALGVEVGYTSDYWSALSGGANSTDQYIDNLDFALSADLDALFGLPRTKGEFHMFYNNGATFSDGNVGDSQIISNIEAGTRSIRPYQVWIEHGGDNDRWSVRLGLYDVNSEFDVLEASGVFLGSAHGIGTDIGQSGRNGPSLFPNTSFGIRSSVSLGQSTILRVAVLDGVPNDPDDPDRTAIKLSRKEGVFSIAELDFTRESFRLLAGAWGYSEDLEDVRDIGKADARKDFSGGVYLRGETQLHESGKRRLNGFFRLGAASEKVNAFDRFFSAGLNWTGLSPGRPHDQTGLAFVWAGTGNPQRQATTNEGGDASPAESIIELTHRFVVNEWIEIQPDVQYVINPGLDRNARNIFAAGLRMIFSHRF